MRTMRAVRNFGSPKAIDTQTIINDNPITVTVTRITGTFKNDTRTRTASSFQARIDPWRNIQREPRANTFGLESDILFLMTTCYSADKDGNAISFQQGDEVSDGTNTYICVAKIPYPSWKNEGVLALRQ